MSDRRETDGEAMRHIPNALRTLFADCRLPPLEDRLRRHGKLARDYEILLGMGDVSGAGPGVVERAQ